MTAIRKTLTVALAIAIALQPCAAQSPSDEKKSLPIVATRAAMDAAETGGRSNAGAALVVTIAGGIGILGGLLWMVAGATAFGGTLLASSLFATIMTLRGLKDAPPHPRPCVEPQHIRDARAYHRIAREDGDRVGFRWTLGSVGTLLGLGLMAVGGGGLATFALGGLIAAGSVTSIVRAQLDYNERNRERGPAPPRPPRGIKVCLDELAPGF